MSKLSEQAKKAEQLRFEREKRITDAIQLKVPDRVPVVCGMGYFPAKYAGIPCSAAYDDFDAWYAAYQKTLPEYPADMISPQMFTPSRALEIINSKNFLWPGHGVSPYHTHQSIEVEHMQAEDYDAFFLDPGDYTLRTYLSRTSESLAGLSDLPRLYDLSHPAGTQMLAMALTSPKVSSAIRTLQQAGRELRKCRARMMKFNKLLQDMGYSSYFQGEAMPPYDVVSHSLRGMTGTMTDMFRRPDTLQRACEKILELTLAKPMPKPSALGQMRFFMTNTRGSDDFLSPKQFATFYWPTFKKLVMTLIERGGTPCIFFEGNFTSRLEYLLEFPKGKLLARLDTTDIFRAKEILQDHVCIEGNVPSTLLQMGSVQDVKDYCKKLIDVVGKGGGYILAPRSSTDEVKPENLKAMIDFTREYGVYR